MEDHVTNKEERQGLTSVIYIRYRSYHRAGQYMVPQSYHMRYHWAGHQHPTQDKGEVLSDVLKFCKLVG